MLGRLVLVFDDGYATDDSLVRPVLEERGTRATFAVVPDWVGGDEYLDGEQVRALADAGHEVAAHGRRHRHLQRHALAEPASEGDVRLALDGHVFPDRDGGVYPGDDYEVADGDAAEVHTVVATECGDDVPVVVLEDELGGDFDPTATVVRLTDDAARNEIGGARDDLREYGVDPETFVYPYDAADQRAWRFASETFETVVNTAVRSLPNPPGTPATNLRRYYFETTHVTRLELREYLDRVAALDGLGVLAGHSAWESVSAERVAFVVEAAHERGVEVTTFADLRDEGWF